MFQHGRSNNVTIISIFFFEYEQSKFADALTLLIYNGEATGSKFAPNIGSFN
jgi:hypothetical protein